MFQSIGDTIRGFFGTLQELRYLKQSTDAEDQALYAELRGLITQLIADYKAGKFNTGA